MIQRPFFRHLMLWHSIGVYSAAGLVTVGLLLAACAPVDPLAKVQPLVAKGDYETAIADLESRGGKTAAADRTAALRLRQQAVEELLAEAAAASERGEDSAARGTLERAARVDPGQPRVSEALRRLDDRAAAIVALAQARQRLQGGDLDGASALAKGALDRIPEWPEARRLLQQVTELREAQSAVTRGLDLGSTPVTLQLRDAPIKQAFEALALTTGLQVAFDRDVRQTQPITVMLRDIPVADALRILTLSAQLDYKTLGPKSVLVYPRNAAKARAYADRVVRVFHISNTLAKDIAAALRNTFRIRDVFSDDKLNLVILRDTPEVVQMAERLVLLQDVPEPEVMLEVEVLEVSRAKLQKLGLEAPRSVSLGVPSTSTTSPDAPPSLGSQGPFRAFIANPALILNLRQRDAFADLLANPRIRVKNRSKARIHIGEKVPVITSNATSTGVISGAVSYLDVGLKLDVEPAVHLDGDVSLGVRLEASSIKETVTLNTRDSSGNVTGSSTVAYRVGTRNTETSLRLKDGETQVIAGLIQDEDRRSREKIPGLAGLPLIGRLFATDGGDGSTREKTEVVLLITPRVLRNISLPARADTRFDAAPELSGGAFPGGLVPIEELPQDAAATLPGTFDNTGIPPQPNATVAPTGSPVR